MHKKVFRYIIASSVIAVLITGIISYIIMQSASIEETKLSTEAMARMVIGELEDDNINYDLKAKQLGQAVYYNQNSQYRITIISEDGTVLGDSIADVEKMDNHSDREEVMAALLYGTGSAIRSSDTIKINMLYVAVKDEQTDLIVRIALPLTELRRMKFNLLAGCLISIFAGIVISVIASFIFSERLSKPIKELATASYEFAGGNMNKRVELKTNTELDELSSAFNKMAENLENSLNKIKHKNAEFDTVLSSIADGLIAVDIELNILYINPVARSIFMITRDQEPTGKLTNIIYNNELISAVKSCITENKSKKAELKLGGEELIDFNISINPMVYKNQQTGAIILLRDVSQILKLERLRSEFVANVSHELRTPLTSIKGYAETLKDEGFKDNENATRFLDIIEIEADRLNVLINDLMELSEIENKKEDVNISRHDFNKILNEVVDVVSINAKKRDVTININSIPNIDVYSNRDRIKQLILNLVDNAIKYNKVGGEVDITVSRNNEMLKISVKDTGDGIKKEDIPRLFERFYRVDKSRSKQSGGTGLGLSIVKHIAELYGGSVTLLSDAGIGSEFIVEMPILIK